MAKCFVVRRAELTVQRIYESVADHAILVGNRRIRIPIDSGGPLVAIEAHERKMWPTLHGPIAIEPMDIPIGCYHPGIARPLARSSESLQVPLGVDTKYAKSVWRELGVVTGDIEKCFDVTSPDQENYKSFGLAYEKIIYFCCIGVESLFRKILDDNSIFDRKRVMATFIRLEPFLHLREYSLSLVRYPWIEHQRPFDGWDISEPSKSLPWFGAYNALKHDKRNSHHLATMKNAILAASGYYLLAYAVLGGALFPGFLGDVFYFHFEDRPKWRLDELYYSGEGETWTALPLKI